MNRFGNGFYGNPLLANQYFPNDLFGGFNSELEMDSGGLNTGFAASMSRRNDPILVTGRSTSSTAQEDDDDGIEDNIEIDNALLNLNTWYSEFEEMKNVERNKVNNFNTTP